MSEVFFTSDLHLCHNKEFIYNPRGFSSIDEHDRTIMNNWNSVVAPEDTVYVLGDIIMGDDRVGGIKKLEQLNGTIVLCRGNHDTDSKMIDYVKKCRNVNQTIMGSETYANIVRLGKWSFYICHFPTMIGDFDFLKSGHKKFCLHGHTHSKDKFQFISGCCYNVALDAHNNYPVNIKQIKEDLIWAMQNKEKFKATGV